MCIAILSPKGTQLSKESLSNCWENNYNGAGFMYNDDNNKLHVVKEMDSFSKFYKKYRKIRIKFPKSTMVLHFRISTHGVIDRSNCHPFKVNNNLGFVHNGVIKTVEENDKYSDTNVFNREILRKIPNISVEMMNNDAMQMLVHEFIGYSKLVFMDNMNNYAIVNEEAGHWEKGVWYSNDSYKKVKEYLDYGGTKVSRGSLGFTKTYGAYGSNTKTYNRWGWDGYGTATETPSTTAKLEDDKGYAISDGQGSCETCGVYLMTGEITSEKGECLLCVSEKEADKIVDNARLDGVECENLNLTGSPSANPLYIAVPESDEKDDDSGCEIVDCSWCGDPSTDTIYISEWESEVCKKCIKPMVDEGYITENGTLGKIISQK